MSLSAHLAVAAALSTRKMSKFSLARAVGTAAAPPPEEGTAEAPAAEDEVGEITLEAKGALKWSTMYNT